MIGLANDVYLGLARKPSLGLARKPFRARTSIYSFYVSSKGDSNESTGYIGVYTDKEGGRGRTGLHKVEGVPVDRHKNSTEKRKSIHVYRSRGTDSKLVHMISGERIPCSKIIIPTGLGNRTKELCCCTNRIAWGSYTKHIRGDRFNSHIPKEHF